MTSKMECQMSNCSDDSVNVEYSKTSTINRNDDTFTNLSTISESSIAKKINQLKIIKSEHQECLTELFFLQNGGNIMDYYTWKKHPNDLLACYLESEKLDDEIYKADFLVNQKSLDESSQMNDDFETSLNMSCSEVSFCGRIEETMDESTIESQDLSFQENGFTLNTSSVLETSQSSEKHLQEHVAELARQEARALKKITELRKHGLWSMRRIPKSHEPPRIKTHWDYVMEEMQWLANDFAQERKMKRTCSKKVSRFISKYFQDLQQKDLKAEKEDTLKLKKIALNISKIVKEFWTNIEKVVQYKQQSRVDEKRKKALDLHLNFIVDQTEKYSSWLTEGLVAGAPASQVPEGASKKVVVSEKAEKNDQSCTNKLLNTTAAESDAESYIPSDEDADDEETIVEQEDNEKIDYEEELSSLQKEGDMPIEELYALYYSNNAPTAPTKLPSPPPPSPKLEKVVVETESSDSNKNKNHLEENISNIAATALSFQPTGNTLETTHVKTPVPFLLKHQLREYQHVGLDWLATMYEQRLNGILADEMGLGKTIQTIALLAFLSTEKGIWGPHLIVVPTSVMLNWEMEFKKWCPGLKILTYYGSLKERKAKRQGWSKTNAFHVCITSYKLVIQDHQAFRRKKWKYFILDEAHNIKNFKSQRWQTLLNFHSQRRLLLTGTPLQNNLMELWSLMHFLMPHVFQSHSEFKEWFSNPLTGMIEGSKEYNDNLIRRLHKVLRPFLLRRLKQDVEKQMPKKYEHVVMCRLSKHQRYLYEDFMSQTKTKETLATGNFMSVINILMQLRKVCNHPNLFDPRPIVSPFHMTALNCSFPRLIVDVFSDFGEHPTKFETIRDIGPGLADLELCMEFEKSLSINKLCATKKNIFSEFPEIFCLNTQKSINDRMKMRRPFNDSELLPYQEEFWSNLEKKRIFEHRMKLEKIWYKNTGRCSYMPMLGADLRHAATIDDPKDLSQLSWNAQGFIHCSNAHKGYNWFWKRTSYLSNLVCTFDTCLERNQAIISRFMFVIPPSTAPTPSMNPYPKSQLNLGISLKHALSKQLDPVFLKLHEINIKQTVQFPDLRLIQYDCGKLQAMDVLLRDLKQGGHRVLIFTQMTKMLDVLEQFLNFHGHRYLRLDGSTKVEQRQVLMERFNMDRKIFCFILSTRSGGIGVNLTGADTVIFYDSDWNPTMDAQAQDRCHRIGQTRDVHIYRLVSEKTIEENILKKANEKRLLGNVAIEGGNFTTAFFKQGAIRDLFEEPTGIESAEAKKEIPSTETSPELTEEQIEQALCAAEDETDIQAAKTAKAEQKEELAEFDESLPWDDSKINEAGDKLAKDDLSMVEVELAMLDKNLSAIERYAVSFMEIQLAPITNEELNKAEEEVGIAREEWELNHLKAIKEEEERKAEEEEDEMLYVSYSENYEKKLKPKKAKLPYLEAKKAKFLAGGKEIKKKNDLHKTESHSWGRPAKRMKLQKQINKRHHPDDDFDEVSYEQTLKRFKYQEESDKDRADVMPAKKKAKFSLEGGCLISHLPENHIHKETAVTTTTSNTAKLILNRQFQAPNKTIVIQKNSALMNFRPTLQANLLRPVGIPSNSHNFKITHKIIENKPTPILEKLQGNAVSMNTMMASQPKILSQVPSRPSQVSPRPILIPSYSNGLLQIKQQNVTTLKTTPTAAPVNFVVLKNPAVMGQNLFIQNSTSPKTNVILVSNAQRPATNIKQNYYIIPNNSTSGFANASSVLTSNANVVNAIPQQRFAKVINQIPTSVQNLLRPPTPQAPSNTVPILEKLAMQLENQNNRQLTPITIKLSSNSNPRLSHPSGSMTITGNAVALTKSPVAPSIQARPVVGPRLILGQNLCYNQSPQIVIINNKPHNPNSTNASNPRFNI